MAANSVPTFNADFNTLELPGKRHWKPNCVSSTVDDKNEDDAGQAAYGVNPNNAPQAVANPLSMRNGILEIGIMPTPSCIEPAQVNNKACVSSLLQTSSLFSQLYGYSIRRAELLASNGVSAAFRIILQDGSYARIGHQGQPR